MATLVQRFSPTIPAGTQLETPYVEPLYVQPNMEVSAIRWEVPPGPLGLMGWLLTMGGEPVLPTNGAWMVADDERDTWQLQGMPESGAWQLTGYNLGDFDHTVYFVFLLDPLPQPTQQQVMASLVGSTV